MYTITPRGAFSLAETARFAYIDREPAGSGDELHLAFCRDGSYEPTSVRVRQARGGTDQDVQVVGDEETRAQVERILGLHVDATGFAEVGTRDPVIATLQAAAPGLRPPLIHSAYEAAIFCILTARRSSAQARAMRRALAEAAGTVLDVVGDAVTCLPPPSYLSDPAPVPGLDPVRRERLVAVARAALDGRLDTATLAALPPERARAEVERIPGIGPFSSAIVVVRSLGHTDYMAGTITELNAHVGRLYGLGHDATPAELLDIASGWEPWRTWTQLHVRSIASRLTTV